jgi:hypothetical protein
MLLVAVRATVEVAGAATPALRQDADTTDLIASRPLAVDAMQKQLVLEIFIYGLLGPLPVSAAIND